MNIRELLEQIELEATTQAEHTPEFREAVLRAIAESLEQVALESLTSAAFDSAVSEFNRQDPDTTQLITVLRARLYWFLEHRIAEALKDTANRIYPRSDPRHLQAVGTVDFVTIKYGGFARYQGVYISDRPLKGLRDQLVHQALDRTYDSYSGYDIYTTPKGEIRPGVSFRETRAGELQRQLLEMARTHTADLVPASVIDELIDVFVHELTHTEQHRAQWDPEQLGNTRRPAGDLEYRSHLDDPKNRKFQDLAQGHAQGTLTTAAEQERYWELYLSSPQEIAAFSNNMATEIARSYGVFDAVSERDLDDALRHDPKQGLRGMLNDTSNITNMIQALTGDRFKKQPGENQRTARLRQAVWQRYVNRTYRSLRAIVDRQRQRLRARDQQQTLHES